MAGYRIKWEFDVEDGDTLEDGTEISTPEDAALAAYEAFTRPNSIAHVFEVTDDNGTHKVDLDENGLEVSPAVLITGGPLGGFTFTGPFRTEDHAEEYADEYGIGGDSDDRWITTLTTPRD